MEAPQIKCDVCEVEKREVNHWLKAVTVRGLEGILFLPAEAAGKSGDPDRTYQDLCGHACAHKRLSAWLDDLSNIDYPPKGEKNENDPS